MMTAQSLDVAYGSKQIISNLEFKANAGELTAIIGPNGSGKTTLLKALSGDVSFSGNVKINGFNLSKIPAWRLASERAFLSQFSSVTFPFTVREVVKLGVLDDKKQTSLSMPDLALQKVGFDGYAGNNYHELSGGEQQRVQLARVLCQVWEPITEGIPRWLFLDEPVSSLDIKHQLKIMDIAKNFVSHGGGVIAVMHDLNLTAMYADKIYLLNQGRVKAFGQPKRVLKDNILEEVFDCKLQVSRAPTSGVPFVLPHSASM